MIGVCTAKPLISQTSDLLKNLLTQIASLLKPVWQLLCRFLFYGRQQRINRAAYLSYVKDNFSAGADGYAKYRPSYPDALFDFIKEELPQREAAWDCATGNGQAAQKLAAFFDHVYATDISQAQLNNAVLAPNITYSVQPAEKTSFLDNAFDLVMVAQAVHWFDFEKFYAEVKRTTRPNALLVIIGYGRLMISPPIDAVLHRFYVDIIGPYWDAERR